MEIKPKNTLTSTEGGKKACIMLTQEHKGDNSIALDSSVLAGELMSIEVTLTSINIYLISMAVGSQGLHCNPAFSF